MRGASRPSLTTHWGRFAPLMCSEFHSVNLRTPYPSRMPLSVWKDTSMSDIDRVQYVTNQKGALCFIKGVPSLGMQCLARCRLVMHRLPLCIVSPVVFMGHPTHVLDLLSPNVFAVACFPWCGLDLLARNKQKQFTPRLCRI